jgi:hypothetical protein
MVCIDVAVSAAAAWFSPPVRGQGALADIAILDLAAHVTSRVVIDHAIGIGVTDEPVLGVAPTTPEKAPATVAFPPTWPAPA